MRLFGLFFLGFFLLTTTLEAAGPPWRLRFVAPRSETGTLQLDQQDPEDASQSSGKGFSLLFGNGFGFGISNMQTDGSVAGNPVSVSADSFDVSYTLGERWSLTLGVGTITAGESMLWQNGAVYATGNVEGKTALGLLGLPFLGGELLVGMRGDEVEYRGYRSSASPNPIGTVITAATRQVLIGFGLFF